MQDVSTFNFGRSGAAGRSNAAGFSLLELMTVVAVLGVLTAAALPMRGAFQRSIAYAAMRDVSTQIRTARLQAVSTNRTMQVRFNCPTPGLYRVVELTGDPVIDNAVNRCAFPYPDLDPNARPNLDGPVRVLPQGITFGVSQNLQISPLGVVTPLTGGMPAVITVDDGSGPRQINVTTSGRIRLP
jgi:prepilin-type N-terminal cleavage/methylation domain-containing protein